MRSLKGWPKQPFRSLESINNLQTRIILILIAIIIPTFLIVTLGQNKLTKPILEDDIRTVGINAGKALASDIISSRLLNRQDTPKLIESRLQEMVYSQPHIFRIDVVLKDPATGDPQLVASNIEEEGGGQPPAFPIVDTVTSDYRIDDNGNAYWDVRVPIEVKSRDPRGPRRVLGSVRTWVSLKVVDWIADTLWRTTATAALFSIVTLILALNYFLRRTIENDRKLREAEMQNVQLVEQLHEAQRQVMNSEKLAVMGQLTASFAHEIGTPLNAVGGHLQLLEEEVGVHGSPERFSIIQGQLSKIEEIVKSFLQSTAKPQSQRQLVDINQMINRTLSILRPRIESLGVQVKSELDRGIGPIRVVPIELEQVLLNLLNNSLDSLKAKTGTDRRAGKSFIEVESRHVMNSGREWAEIEVYDTGEGIRKTDLNRVLKPFFTTKRPGEGTGLGLTICQQLVTKYGGELEIDSREGAWTRVTIKLPYREA
jgi:signal transduction histidine kinase